MAALLWFETQGSRCELVLGPEHVLELPPRSPDADALDVRAVVKGVEYNGVPAQASEVQIAASGLPMRMGLDGSAAETDKWEVRVNDAAVLSEAGEVPVEITPSQRITVRWRGGR